MEDPVNQERCKKTWISCSKTTLSHQFDGSDGGTNCPVLRIPSSLWRMRREMWPSYAQNSTFHQLKIQKLNEKTIVYNQNLDTFPPEIMGERSKELTWKLINFLFMHNDLIQPHQRKGYWSDKPNWEKPETEICSNSDFWHHNSTITIPQSNFTEHSLPGAYELSSS